MPKITTTTIHGSTMIARLDYSPIGGGRGVLVAWLHSGRSIARIVPSWTVGLIAAGWPVAGERSSPGRAANVFLLGRAPKSEPPVRDRQVPRASRPFRGAIRQPRDRATVWTQNFPWLSPAEEVAA